ncbi:MAG: hypothetical protein RLY49_555 [Candidatus Parcubacteria bacterium]
MTPVHVAAEGGTAEGSSQIHSGGTTMGRTGPATVFLHDAVVLVFFSPSWRQAELKTDSQIEYTIQNICQALKSMS